MGSMMLPKDSHTMKPRELKRLSGQNARVHARLCMGPATRRQLAEIACNPTARVSDVRCYLKPRGQDIKVTEHADGWSLYEIVNVPSEHPPKAVSLPPETWKAKPHDTNDWNLR